MVRRKTDDELNSIALKIVDIDGIGEILKSLCEKTIYRYTKGTSLNLTDWERKMLRKADYGDMIISGNTEMWEI